MDFSFTDEQMALSESVLRFARERLAPDYMAREQEGVFDRALVREMGALGMLVPNVPERLGGMEADSVMTGLITEGVAFGDFNLSYLTLLGALLGGILAEHARPPLAEKWVPKIAAGETLIALGLTEPAVGSDAAKLKLKARRAGDGYVLNGEKTSISAADQADIAIVFGRTGSEAAGAKGVSAFLVELDQPGITRTRFDDLGSTIVGRGSLFFDDVKVSGEALLGEENGGFTQIMKGFDFSRAIIGLQCLGAARASLDETWAYVQEREAFGAPLAKFEGVTFPLAEAETFYEACRLLCYKTLWLRDQGLPHTAEAAMCKWWAPKLSFDILHQCLLLHGHYGYSKETPHQQRLRDVMGLEIGDGTAQVQKIVIARERIGRIAVPY
ncbi:MAG: acyl-CoA dehydrogenase family protein [Alphaproteobacteria bacterium]|nr:acyl-CoA dehydrogenase family protein [Alphaproteobacteria bacterium]